jgi:hypothetical protein
LVIYNGLFLPIVLFDYLFARSAIFFKNILELEKENKQIILHKEGLFIKVYERSAYLFTKHIKEYKLTKKNYKNAKQEVVYLGFPKNSFSKIDGICKNKVFNLIKRKKNR